MKLVIRVSEGMRPPKLFGRAYRKWEVPETVCAIFPLNWLIGWGRKLCLFLLRGVKPSKLDRRVRKARGDGYQEGYKYGHKRGLQEGLDRFIDGIEEKLNAKEKERENRTSPKTQDNR